MVTPRQAGRLEVRVVALGGGSDFDRQMMVPTGQTVGFAVQASGVRALHPALATVPVAVFGRLVALETVVQAGDRVELALPCDPLVVRQVRERGKLKQVGAQKPETTPENNCPLPKATLPG